MMPLPVSTEVLRDILIIRIDHPPVNALSHGVRQGLLVAFEELNRNPALVAAIIQGERALFIGGADVREFDQPVELPTLPDVVRAIETSAKPIVAAIEGVALGGGFELALACDARVATDEVMLGLPEVTLGVIPGAGGTQLLPRRIGLSHAIGMIAQSQRISAHKALQMRLVDEVVAANVLEAAAIARARALQGGKVRLRDEPVPEEDSAVVDRVVAVALRAGKNRPAVRHAIEAIRCAATLPIEEGLVVERQAFLELRSSVEAAALRHVFFAERQSMKLPTALHAEPVHLRLVCVIGAGTMGAGIAIALLEAGMQVWLLEQDPAALLRGQERVLAHYRQRVASQKMTQQAADDCVARLHPTIDWADLAQVDLVVEAVFEDLAVKQAVFRKIEQFAGPTALLATNTSYLDVDAIAQVTARPEDVLGLHFFSPAHVMKLLEVVRGERTRPGHLATAMALGKRLRKFPVLASNSFGFIGNRIYNAYRNQCEFMLEDGAWPEEIDAALTGFGFAMGPFAVADLSGLDIAWRMRQAQAGARSPGVRYVDVLDRLCEAGRLGQKTGAGYYMYTEGKAQQFTDPVVRDLILDASRRRGLVRQPFPPDTIQRRALLSIVNEAARLLNEGVAMRASDIDVVMVNGYGFPRWQGGPVFWSRQQERKALAVDMRALAEASGEGFVLADLACLYDL
jgi:3-hydroxyacyl-CoA dehydrogenase